jgi:hypothetical protein
MNKKTNQYEKNYCIDLSLILLLPHNGRQKKVKHQKEMDSQYWLGRNVGTNTAF